MGGGRWTHITGGGFSPPMPKITSGLVRKKHRTAISWTCASSNSVLTRFGGLTKPGKTEQGGHS